MNNLEKKIGNILFRKYDEFWISDIEFNSIESSIEIYKETLNEVLLKKILSELNGKVLELDFDGQQILFSLSKAFWGHSQNNIFKFSGIVIDNTSENLFIDFRMCYHCSGEDNFSDYANWYIDIKDFKIVGCSRFQL